MGNIWGTTKGVTKGDTRSLDYSSCAPDYGGQDLGFKGLRLKVIQDVGV